MGFADIKRWLRLDSDWRLEYLRLLNRVCCIIVGIQIGIET